MKVSITVNGKKSEHDVEPRTLLVHYVRENLGLTGTNIGCDTSSCGACTVHLNGEAVKSCTILAAQADGCSVEQRWRDASNATSIHGKPWIAVRLLHTWNGDGSNWIAE